MVRRRLVAMFAIHGLSALVGKHINCPHRNATQSMASYGASLQSPVMPVYLRIVLSMTPSTNLSIGFTMNGILPRPVASGALRLNNGET